VEYSNYVGSMITNGTRCTQEITPRIAMANAAPYKMLFISKLEFSALKIILKCYI